jgi:hypothetical protein
MNKRLRPYSSPHPPLSPVKKRPRPKSSPLLGENQRGGGRKNDEAFYLRENSLGWGENLLKVLLFKGDARGNFQDEMQ